MERKTREKLKGKNVDEISQDEREKIRDICGERRKWT